ncbi:MAG: hypothetical protein QNJ47_07725 [Nostocaceae cyanobacterium]|nr:hypothetical protein [Nostocaceae cyanobacterium]
MSKPNFDTMSKAELRTYVIAHQDDQEAFYALVDRLTANKSSVKYPASMTPEEINKAVLEQIQKRQTEKMRKTMREKIAENNIEIAQELFKEEDKLQDT